MYVKNNILQYISSIPLFSGTAFPAYAEAFEAGRLLFVGRESLIGLIGDDPSFAMAMLGVLSLRLRRFVRVIEGLSLREAPQSFPVSSFGFLSVT